MATIIKAGNVATGAQITSDATGILEVRTGTGAGTTALTINASQAATFAGAITSSGLVTGSTGALYPLVSGTVNAGGTNPFPSSGGPVNVDFTGIPSWAKRITVMFSGLSTNGTSNPIVQLGDAGGIETTGYASFSSLSGATNAGYGPTTVGFVFGGTGAANLIYGSMVLTLVGANLWVASVSGGLNAASNTPFGMSGGGNKTLSDVLDRVRITTGNGTDTFDAGTINIMWE
jgi:hypothetical protein